MPGARIGRSLLILVALVVIAGLLLSALGTPRVY
jgi:hypothetical protein